MGARPAGDLAVAVDVPTGTRRSELAGLIEHDRVRMAGGGKTRSCGKHDPP